MSDRTSISVDSTRPARAAKARAATFFAPAWALWPQWLHSSFTHPAPRQAAAAAEPQPACAPPIPQEAPLRARDSSVSGIRSAQAAGSTERASTMTARQREVLRLLVNGYSTKQIARELGISISTAKAHTSSVFRALDVSSRAQAVVVGVRYQVLEGADAARCPVCGRMAEESSRS